MSRFKEFLLEAAFWTFEILTNVLSGLLDAIVWVVTLEWLEDIF